jgi:tripartite-type tricarboxylate transporter receptor subunit TctC
MLRAGCSDAAGARPRAGHEPGLADADHQDQSSASAPAAAPISLRGSSRNRSRRFWASQWWWRTGRAQGGIVGGDQVAKGQKDGYTLLMMSNAHAVSAAMYKTLPYDPVKDFQMLSLVATAGLVMITAPEFPASDVKGAIALLKADPGKYNFGSAGVGTTQQFAAELMNQMAGVKITHVPYRSTPAVVTALLSKDIHYAFELIQVVSGQIQAKTLKAIAVTSPARYPSLADVPTFAESGLPGYDVTSWYGLAMAPDTPRPIVDKLNKAVAEALNRPAIRKQISDIGAQPKTSTPEELSRHIAAEIAKWQGVREKAGIPQL